jgi:hypothetical protein
VQGREAGQGTQNVQLQPSRRTSAIRCCHFGARNIGTPQAKFWQCGRLGRFLPKPSTGDKTEPKHAVIIKYSGDGTHSMFRSYIASILGTYNSWSCEGETHEGTMLEGFGDIRGVSDLSQDMIRIER